MRIALASLVLFASTLGKSESAPPPATRPPSATPGLTAASSVRVPEGFRATRVYEVPKAQGSWVALTNERRGRLVACNQYGSLYRITLGDEVQVEELKTPVGKAQGLLYAFGSLYVMGKNGKAAGLFRLTDTTGDDHYDQVEHLIGMPVGNEHQGHAIVLAPGGESIYICGGNMTRMPKLGFTASRMPQNWKGDHLLPRMPDARGHNTGGLPVGGWIARISPDASERELIANGFRNEYDIGFDTAGELFTYDSDMEYDIGSPWYRPTRINHVVSGAEFGWRYGTGKWPDYYADSVGSILDVGPGSPTGVTFGTGARFPAKYQRAMFVGDWSYGVIYAVHLEAHGGSYRATKEAFATAAPLAVTDMVIREADGALYFLLGGRGSRSSLHKVEYIGEASTTKVRRAPLPPEAAVLHRLRRNLEAFHGKGLEQAVTEAWPHLGHPDRAVRFAARLAVESVPVSKWRERLDEEKDDRAYVHAAIALARHGEAGDQKKLLQRLTGMKTEGWSEARQLEHLRAVALVFTRLGMEPADDAAVAQRERLAATLSARYPGTSRLVNQELCRVLSFLNAPDVVEKSLDLQAAAPSQEEQLHYAYCLRVVTRGWTKKLRQRYFRWFERAASYRGGSSFRGFCNNVRKEAIQRLSEDVRAALGALVGPPPKPKEVVPVAARKFVKNWTVKELVQPIESRTDGHDFERGRRLYGAAACVRCHRFQGEGGAVGPDLTSVRGRFGVTEILEAIIEPSKVISDQYQPSVFEMKNGDYVVGYVANLNRNTIKVVENMLKPGDMRSLPVDQIVSQQPSKISMMPAGLLSTLTLEEIQDLIAYMRSGGDKNHALFK